MIETIRGWRGQDIVGVRSRSGGEFWARDWRDMVPSSSGEITTKAGRAPKASSWFQPDDFAILCEVHEHCCYLQSLRSEDTMTWAAFGPHVPDAVLDDLMALAFGAVVRGPWRREHWRRYPHPDTNKTHGGPEPDAVLVTNDFCCVVESKWLADLDEEQGVDGTTSQLAMRATIAASLISDPVRRRVLAIAPSPKRYGLARKPNFARYFAANEDRYAAAAKADQHGASALTWEQVTDTIERHMGDVEVVQYLRWRLRFLDQRT